MVMTLDRSAGLPPVRTVAVPSLSFSQHAGLVALLRERYPDAKINAESVNHHHSDDAVIAYLRGHEAAIVSFERINEAVLEALPDLRVVVKLGVGLDLVDPAAMQRHGVRLGWKPGVNKTSVAELALALALALLRQVPALNMEMRAGARPLQRTGRQLSGRTVGIHGCGHIGQELARLLQPFGCTILAHDIKDYPEAFAALGVTPVGIDELLERSEVLSLHLPVTDKTQNFYTGAVLDKLRPDCVLINTARGRLIDEEALKERLRDGRIAGAGIDAFQLEPPDDDELLRLPNLLATPHIGAASQEARWAMGTTAIAGLTDNFIPEPGVYPFEDR